MHLKQCAYILSEHCHMPNGTDRGYSITVRNRYHLFVWRSMPLAKANNKNESLRILEI